MGSAWKRWERRNKLLEGCYRVSLGVLGVIVVYHWLSRDPYGVIGKSAVCVLLAIILAGFLHALVGIGIMTGEDDD
jgi:hypothetical protein